MTQSACQRSVNHGETTVNPNTTPSAAGHPTLPEGAGKGAGIFYLCPDTQVKSAGVRRLYRHVALLTKNGFKAHILHLQHGFRRADMPEVPLRHLDRIRFNTGDIVVIPEGCPTVMEALKDLPIRRFAIALNWDYVYRDLQPGTDWRSFNIERVLSVSPSIAGMISWAMDLPTHVLASSVDNRLYYVEADAKLPHVVYIARKAGDAASLMRMLGSRNAAFINNFKWIGLHSLSEAEYAAQIRKAAVFLNLSMAEGYPTSCLEAMASGTLVASYASMGQVSPLRGEGHDQNCLLAPIGDYITLARTMDPLLSEMVSGKMRHWNRILSNGIKTVAGLTLSSEETALIRFWRGVQSQQPGSLPPKECKPS